MKAKKIMAVLMTAAVLMGTAVGSTVTTFAAPTATITVSNLDEAASWEYLQVVEPDTSSTDGWKFVDGYADEFMAAFGVTTEAEAIKKVIALGGDTNAATGKIHENSKLNAALTALRDEVMNEGTPVEGTSTEALTKAGLYVIVATSTNPDWTYVPMMAYIKDDGLGNLESATVVAKGSDRTIDKNLTSGKDPEDSTKPSTDESVSEGDIVQFTAEVVYPFYTTDSVDHSFEITDTLTNGTFEAGTVSVSIKGEPDLAVPSYSINEYANTNTLHLDFSESYDYNYAGKTLVITYSAKVGAGEGDVVNDIDTNLDTDGDSVTLDKVAVQVTKTGENDTKLANATFVIYEASETAKAGYDEMEVPVVEKDAQGATAVTKTLYLKEIVSKTTDLNGKISFDGLDANKIYYVKETIAPTGYTVNPNYYAVGTTSKSDTSTDDVYVYNDFAPLTVNNETLSALPSTGGIGTTIFTIGGCVIMIVAAGMYFASRRKEEN